MRHCLVLHRTSTIAAIAFILATLCPRNAVPNEVEAGGGARGLIIHDATETLRDFCVRDESGVLWLVLPGGARFELITSIDDPSILNRGDGAFHPYDAHEVRRAIDEVRFPLAGIRADVFLLPYPRRQGLDSAAGDELVLLAPGVRPLSAEHQHAEVVHELGHVVQYALMPDDSDRWSVYRSLRGIADLDVYSAHGMHANRPHEIFAEDFRALFGGALAVGAGTIENSEIANPAAVHGLDRFLLSLAGVGGPSLELAAEENPARGAVRLVQAGGARRTLDLFDVTGRRVATVEPQLRSGGVEWTWDGSLASGARFRGVLFARPRGSARALKVTLLQ